MPKTSRQLRRFLKRHGFIEKSQCGSHLKMYNRELNITVMVPIHSRDLGKGMEKEILKQAHLKRGDK